MSIEVGEKRILNNVLITNQTDVKPVDNKSFEESDAAELSDSANTLKNLPINLSTAKISEENNNIYFDFSFNETRFQKATANGYYSSKEKNLSMSFKFYLEKILYENGNPKTEKFQIEFSVNYSNAEIQSSEKKIEKENIINFLNRVLNDVSKILNDDKKNIIGIIFDKEDLHELMQINDKEVGKFLNEIILLIQTLAKIKKFKNPDSLNMFYNPKRISHEFQKTKQINNKSIDMKLAIRKTDE